MRHDGRVATAAWLAAGWLAAGLLGGCASSGGGALAFQEAGVPASEEAFPNWPLPPLQVDALLASAPFEVRSEHGAGAGLTGAEKVVLFFPDTGVELEAKWKAAPPGRLDGINNSPRKELAAYAIQRLFLDPADYVVPTSVARCRLLDTYHRNHPKSQPNVDGANCVLGVLSVWLENVTVPTEVYDEGRFREDPAYAYYLANFNLLTYLISHKDGRSGNFLVSRDAARPQLFSVDNGVSMRGAFYNWFVPNWQEIRVPALRRVSLDRLRQVRREDLDFLAVLAHLEADAQGVLRSVDPPPTNLDPTRGVRVQGTTVQLGFTQDEIGDVERRIRDLIRDVDAGRIRLI